MILKRLLILSMLALAGCGTAYRPELNKAENLMNEHPDSALVILRKIGTDEIRGRKSKAKYALLYSQALDKNYIDVDNDSIIRIARDYYAHHGSNEDRAKAFYYYGTVANNAGDIDGAMKAYVPARIYAEKTDDGYIKGLIYSAIGNLYYDQNSLEEAIGMLDKAESAFAQTDKLMNLYITVYRKGVIYNIIKEYNNAISCFHDAKNIAKILNDTTQILNSNLCIVLNHIKTSECNYNEYKFQLFNLYKEFNHNTIPQAHYTTIGELYLKLGNIDSAKYFLLNALNNNIITNDNIGTYITLSNIEKKLGNYEQALGYREIYNQLNDSITTVQNNNLIEKLDRKYKTQYIQRSYEVLETKHRLQKLTNILIIILTAIIGGILFSLYKYDMRRKNEKITEYMDYIEDVKSNYEYILSKYDKLKQSTALNASNEEKLLELLGRRIDSLKALCDLSIKNPLSSTFRKKFAQYMNLENKENKALAEDLVTLANIIHNDIITSMADKFELTDHEKTFCACVMLDFNKEDIRVLFNHTNMSSIYNTRCKMREKFGIKGEKLDLLKFIRMVRETPAKVLS